jgi:hypothetical protein
MKPHQPFSFLCPYNVEYNKIRRALPILIDQPTNYMEQSHSGEFNDCFTAQEIPSILWNLKV